VSAEEQVVGDVEDRDSCCGNGTGPFEEAVNESSATR